MSQAQGAAFYCDQFGEIKEILQNPPEWGIPARVGMPFARLAAPGSLGKALSFLQEIRSQNAAFDWSINIASGEEVKSLHFTGGRAGEHFLIVGSENGQFSQRLYEEMMRISNEQTNALRAAYKQSAQDDALYDEISRLNNELVGMQRELAKKNAELEHLNAEKNRFLGMAAHDLRNPLHAILSHSEFLMEYESLSEQAREFLGVIYSSSEFMARLVDDLLDVAKIESGELTLDYAVVDLAELIRKNAAVNRPLAARKQIEIDYSLADIPPAAVDPAKLLQVLNNLIGNAVKFSEPGSRVEIRLEAAGENFLLAVSDHGCGIPAEQQARLFQPFQRGQRGTSGEKSTGLGLSIVKRIVEGHGGKIWLESAAGSGTTFFVSIPFQPSFKETSLVSRPSNMQERNE